ncbi:MAG: hypothetical protein M0Z46_04450 [Actinomycetota bacterium]|nr:hypothetical protein [Actinomycetota bacterium]
MRTGAGSPATVGLRPRPEADPLVVALVASAVLALSPERARRDGLDERVERVERAARAWRFSGRWWTRPAVLRRERPWTR